MMNQCFEGDILYCDAYVIYVNNQPVGSLITYALT